MALDKAAASIITMSDLRTDAPPGCGTEVVATPIAAPVASPEARLSSENRRLNRAKWRSAGKERTVFAVFTAIVGFLATLVLTIVLMNELMPRAFAEWQSGSKNRLVLLGFCIFVIAWIGAYFGYLLGS
jgi:hypothetical protein